MGRTVLTLCSAKCNIAAAVGERHPQYPAGRTGTSSTKTLRITGSVSQGGRVEQQAEELGQMPSALWPIPGQTDWLQFLGNASLVEYSPAFMCPSLDKAEFDISVMDSQPV